jgi:outer membrane protein assembly factor BamB
MPGPSRARVALLPLVLLTSAADWPQWLGPQRNGLSDEAAVVKVWSTTGPKVLWKANPGIGYSGVAIADGRAYTLGSVGEDELLIAFDALTGAQLWTHRLDSAYDDKMGYDGPRATPTVVDGKVVALGAKGVIAVVDAKTGAPVWSHDLVRSFRGGVPTWGYSGSPLVSDGKVFLSAGGRDSNGLMAFSLADGSTAWTQGEWGAGYSSPVRTTLGGVDQVVFFTATAVVGTVPGTGKVLWSHPWTTSYDVNAATPLVIGPNQLFVASGYGTGAALLELGPGNAVSEVWKTKRMKNKLATSIRYGDHLYGFNEEQLTALDLATGEDTWSDGSYGRGTLIGVGDHLIVLSETCEVSLIKAAPDALKIVAPAEKLLEGKPCWTVPSLANGIVYLRSPSELVALDLRP